MADGRHRPAGPDTGAAASWAAIGGNVRILGLAGAIAAMLLALGIAEVAALPLTPFRYEDQAQRYCPGDRVVWLDFKKGVYYRKGQKLFGQGFDGSYVCLNEAKSSGFRRSLLGVR